MLRPWQFWCLCGLGVISFALVGVNIGLYRMNRAGQLSVNARAQYLQQTSAIRDLSQQIAKGLAELSLKTQDTQLAAMLATEGFQVTATPPSSAPKSVGKP